MFSIFFSSLIIGSYSGFVSNVNNRKTTTLFNNSEIVGFFPSAKKVIVSLANNHMYDYLFFLYSSTLLSPSTLKIITFYKINVNILTKKERVNRPLN